MEPRGTRPNTGQGKSGWIEPPAEPSHRPPDPDPLALTPQQVAERDASAMFEKLLKARAAPAPRTVGWIEPPGEPPHKPPVPDPLAASRPHQPPARATDSRREPTAPAVDPPSLAEAEAYIRAHMTQVSPNMRTYGAVRSPHFSQQRGREELIAALTRIRQSVLDQEFAHIRPEGSPLPQLLAPWQRNLLAELVASEPRIRSGELINPAERTLSEDALQQEIDRCTTLWHYIVDVSTHLRCDMCGRGAPFSRYAPQHDPNGPNIGGLSNPLSQCVGCGRLICYACLQGGRCDKCRISGRIALHRSRQRHRRG